MAAKFEEGETSQTLRGRVTMKNNVVNLCDVLAEKRRRGDAEKVGKLFGHTTGVRARQWTRPTDGLNTGAKSPLERGLVQTLFEFHVNKETGYASAFWFNYLFWLYALRESNEPISEVEAVSLLTEACRESIEAVFDDSMTTKEKRLKILCAGAKFWQVVAGINDDAPADEMAIAA